MEQINKIKAPFSKEQVEKLNEYQGKGEFHPFTCCSDDAGGTDCERRNGKEGKLIATEEGWVCPCGKYSQKWAHKFMSE